MSLKRLRHTHHKHIDSRAEDAGVEFDITTKLAISYVLLFSELCSGDLFEIEN